MPGQAPPQHASVRGRDPADAGHLLWFLAITAVALVASVAGPRTTAGIEADLLQLLGVVPIAVIGLIVLGVQVLYLLLFLGIPVMLVITRQWRLLAIGTLGYCSTVLIVLLLTGPTQDQQALELPQSFPQVTTSTDWLTSPSLGAAVTILVLISPQLNRAWWRFGWSFAVVLAVIRAITSGEEVLDMVLAIGIGGSVGYLLLVLFGRRITVPTPQSLSMELRQLGIVGAQVSALQSSPGGSLWFEAGTADLRLHCKVLTAQGYQADRLLRAFRRVRVRELGEDAPFSTVRRAAAVEAMLAMSAVQAGVSTPALRGIAALSDNDMIMVFDRVEGRPLSRLEPDEVSDDVLAQAWRALAALRAARIAHRNLNSDKWLLGDDGRLWLVDFSFGEPAATAGAMSGDIAELLAATYPLAGEQRAVAAAVSVLGPEALGEGLSHLVPVALTRQTRAAVKGATDGLAPLVAAAAAACRVAEPQFAPIARFKPRTLVMVALLAVAIYVLLPQLADLPRILQAVRGADPEFLAAAAAGAVTMFLGVGLALRGSIPAPVGYGYTFTAGVAAGFVGAVAPPTVARVGVNVRFAQKQGLESTVAVSSAAAKELATGVVHIVLLLFVAVLAGRSEALTAAVDASLSGGKLAIGFAVVVALLSVAFAVPRIRALVRDAVLPAVKRSVGAMRELAADPGRMVALFAGALVMQLGFISTLYFSVRALGGEVTLITIALIYLTVGSAATIAPTPGGLGAVEAVLIATLTGIGLAAPQAVAGVFLYRLLTFWLPIPFGAVATRFLTARDML